ncbi:hypothetical protein [Natrialba aegyptia]|uniref:ABC-type dipeptide transport system, periplasmic component n=1 Tax=Natrialba aegyptia DSM 13077 TaxID=1227491 RepID=M0B3V3_9EURY|nr:hypothetical protein [Natrialba aegyptia]ELZ05576.1 ABC-type dipeptide transport system, periplasmic component [Natrialba aegyptia DSM 13077]
MDGPYAQHLLDASDVCSNCLRKNRVERIDPVRGGLVTELDSHLSRDETRTSVGYGPADCVSEQKGVFCECGVEGAFERLWDPTAVAEDEFKTLVKAALATLAEKDVTVRRKETVMYALSHYRDHGNVDRALASALDAGIVAAAAAGNDDRDQVRA